ncbi:MAG: NYN domain-containing protein [Hyphomicrobiaceae bacterium]
MSAVFVDYDNIYLSLRRKNEEAAKRFAKDAGHWIREIETGSLITSTNGQLSRLPRRIVMNRCYGNPQPRRNPSDNSTDMTSFPFVRHHFLRAGFEIVDCHPLTAQLKNASDIRIVMDVRDFLSHETHFDEFIILSGDADFTPVLHRLRAHGRRTVIYATDYTAVPYTAISDGEVREADLIAMLLEGKPAAGAGPADAATAADIEANRRSIIDEVVTAVRTSGTPVPLEVLADRAVRAIGHDRTIGTGWAGAGGFRELLAQGLPAGIRLSGEPPYVVIDTQRHLVAQPAAQRLQTQPLPASLDIAEPRVERPIQAPIRETAESRIAAGIGRLRPTDAAAQPAPTPAPQASVPFQPPRRPILEAPQVAAPAVHEPQPVSSAIQLSIARIHEACKAPPLAPPEYRLLFELMAQEITENGLIGAQTIQNIAQRAQDRGIDVRRDDVRFVLEVVSEADPWFEQGASANLFAGRFRNFVVARCRAQGLTLSADELDLVEAWFAGSGLPTASVRHAPAAPAMISAPPPRPAPPSEAGYWSGSDERQQLADARGRLGAATATDVPDSVDDFPRMLRTRIRG